MPDPIDVFAGTPIYQDLDPRDLTWLRAQFGKYLTGSWDRGKVTLEKVWTTEGTMTGTVRIVDAHGQPVPNYSVTWSWPGTAIPVQTNGDGRADMYISEWIDQGGRTPGREKGPFAVEGDGWRFEGIGWAAGTNHRKPNVQLSLKPSAPPDPGPPPTPDPAPGPSGDIRAQLNAIADTLSVMVQQLRALGR